MIDNYPEIYLLLPILYAETHYRFKYFLSYLFKSEPEIIADLPSRIEPETALPVLIIVKDAHRFPVFINKVYIIDSGSGNKIDSFEIEQYIDVPLWEHIHFVSPERLDPSHKNIDVQILYSTNKNKKVCLNDNHRGSSHDSLPVFISKFELPRIGNCIYGDAHVHTSYTSDQVEFAPSIKTIAALAHSMGLHFFCATDHSYDLDDHPDNYLLNDSNLTKWHDFKKEVEIFNRQEHGFVVVPGEEVSIRNKSEKNVHCIVYNSQRFFPGSGDGAERWPDTRCELSLEELIAQLDEGSIAFAAHPGEKPAFLQRLLINRGQWTDEDCNTPGLTGLQIINSAENNSDDIARQLWIKMLLKGIKVTGICGTDSHGNFARYRQISFPFFTIKEHYYHLFGQWRTGIYLTNETLNNININIILDTLKNGRCFMTNGPALRFSVQTDSLRHDSGYKIAGNAKICIEAVSNPEFFGLNEIILYIGLFDEKQEKIYKSWHIPEGIYQFEEIIAFHMPARHGYLRVEAKTMSGRYALSNPIWF